MRDDSVAGEEVSAPYYIPPEFGPQRRVWMAYAHRYDIWGANLKDAQREQVRIASIIKRYVQVRMLIPEDALSLPDGFQDLDNIEFVPFSCDDLWIRDTLGTFAKDGDQVVIIDWNYNTWGGKTRWCHQAFDESLCKRVAARWHYPRIQAPICCEGMATMTADGEGTVITTESCLLHPDRNPGKTKADIEQVFRELCGWKRTIWLPGREDWYESDTHGHVDGLCFFSKPGQVVWGMDTGYEEGMSAMVTEGLHRLLHEKLEIVSVLNPRPEYFPADAPDDFCAEYANGLLLPGVFLIPETDDPNQVDAIDIFKGLWPDREIIPVALPTIASHGGGLHCATLNEPM